MIGITLSPEQISQAPPDVRRWLEQQIVGLLNASRAKPAMQPPERHLIGCDLATARGILSLINEILPVVSVFFELAREPAAATAQGLRALRLDEMARHARLQGPEQVMACLRTIDEALQRVCDAPDALLTALDGAGHCLVADTTARSILALWQEIVAARDLTARTRGSRALCRRHDGTDSVRRHCAGSRARWACNRLKRRICSTAPCPDPPDGNWRVFSPLLCTNAGNSGHSGNARKMHGRDGLDLDQRFCSSGRAANGLAVRLQGDVACTHMHSTPAF
jgi:hypothetical protein